MMRQAVPLPIAAMFVNGAQAQLGGGGPPPTNLISSVAADGWQASWAAGVPPTFDPNGAPVTQTFTRSGFDAVGAPTTFSADMTILRRVRQVFPNELTDVTTATATSPLNAVALQDYIYSTDSRAGVTNGSTEVSPVPIANWVVRDRQLVGDSIYWEISAFHRDFRLGQMVSCVQVRGNDGTTQTAWQSVSVPVQSGYCEDTNPIEVYAGTLSIAALATGLIWLEAKIYPWVGDSSSVLLSESSTDPHILSRRYHLKDTARFNAPPSCFVASAGASPPGDDTAGTGGIWSTDLVAAAARPFLTVTGAETAMTVGANATVTGSKADGCIAYIVDTVSMGAGPATTRPQNCAAFVVRRAPGTARANAIINHAASHRPRLGVTGLLGGLTEGAIFFDDVTINRTGAFTIFGEASNKLQIALRNVNFPNTSVTNLLSNSHLSMFGVTFPTSNIPLGYVSTTDRRMIRGVTVDMNSSGIQGGNIIGCNISRSNDITYRDTTQQAIFYNNKWINPSSTGGVGGWSGTVSGADFGALAYVQNLIECYHTNSSTAGFRIANDNQLGNITHAVVYADTDTGFGSVDRANYFYDDAGVARFHKRVRHVGCIVSQLNTKGDVFQADGTRIGQFAYSHGVGCQGNFTMFRVNAGTPYSEYQTFPGPGSVIGTSTTVRNDPLFVNYQASNNSGGAAATGGGNYVLQAGSPARGIVTRTGLKRDLAGNARAATNDASGCYA